MKKADYQVVVIGGWCGNLLFIVADHLREIITGAGYPIDLKTHSVWENYSQPPPAQLILQLIPAYSEADVDCPIINIRRLLVDRDHEETLDKIFTQLQADFQV